MAKHFVAISTNEAEVRKFGIAPENMFVFWDWVGGRYSLWSSIGLPIALAVGYGHFEQLLDGAHEMDEHFRTAPLEQNVPITLGLLGVWYASVLGAEIHAVLPYEQYLHRLPAYLQQLDMESNGKRVDRDGRPVAGQTAADRVGRARHQRPARVLSAAAPGHAPRSRPTSSSASSRTTSSAITIGCCVANCLAQTEALMRGKTEAEVRARADGAGLFRRGARSAGAAQGVSRQSAVDDDPLRKLGPRTLGMLLALYEHRVFTMGAVWQINSFDQWGVELGKQLATTVVKDLAAAGDATGARQLDDRADRLDRRTRRRSAFVPRRRHRERRRRQQLLEGVGVHGRAEVVALAFVAVLRAQVGELVCRLDALGDDAAAQALAHRDHRAHQRRAVGERRDVLRRTTDRSSARQPGSAAGN